MSGSTTRQLTSRSRQVSRNRSKSQLQPGDLLQNRYRIMGVLGSGGFSSVYQARDMHFSSVTRLCAIKEMVNVSSDPDSYELARRSFETEASILATLSHPSIPDVYDYFSDEVRSYLVMEFIRGKDLEGVLEERKAPIPQDELLEWALQITEVLTFLHSHQPQPIVFRDLKPSNIMLDHRDQIRLIDFGIAKVFQQTAAKGTMIGTEGYSPPEQYRGEASPAGDVYALGATFHHLLTMKDPRLQPPFSWHERPVSQFNTSASSSMEALINRCLSYKPGERYQDAMELMSALKLIQSSGFQAGLGSAPSIEETQPPARFSSEPETKSPAMTQPGPSAAPKPVTALSGSDIQPLWAFSCEDEIRTQPAVDDKSVFVGAYDNNLYALDRQTGEFKWKYPATDGIGTSPVLFKDDIFFGSVDQNLYSINRHNGRLQWTLTAEGAIYSSPTAEFDHVFFGSDDGNLYAVNAGSGRILWKANAHGRVRSSPLITDESIYFGTEDGYFFCLDLHGKIKWQFQAKRAVTSSPIISEDMIFFGSMDSTVYALDANSGWAIWRARTTRPIISTPVVQGEVVYIGSSDGKMYAFDLYNGRQIWTYETMGQVTSSPAIWDDALYFGSTDSHIYSLELKKGKLRWKFKTDAYVISSPTIDKGVIYVGSCDHKLYALPV